MASALPFTYSIIKVLKFSSSAGCDYGDIDGIGDGFVELVIVTGLSAISIHTGQQYLSCTEFFGFDRPFNGVEVGRFGAGFYSDLPSERWSCLNGGHRWQERYIDFQNAGRLL